MTRTLALLMLLAAPAGALTLSRPMMSTTVTITVPDAPGAAAAVEAAFGAMEVVERVMNEWRPGTPLSELNRQAGKRPVKLPSELMGLLARSREIAEQTDGAFDPTWAALWGLWDFNAPFPRPPSKEAIEARLPLVGWKNLKLSTAEGTAYLPRAGMAVGLGGIAKGYALAKARDVLTKSGIERFVITAGGQVLAGAPRPDRGWRVGIRDPRGDPEDSFAILEVSHVSVSTSGDYERTFTFQGQRFHHILDPRTGRPARGLRSATVVSPDPILADALSTAFMVMGRARALDLAGRLGVEAVLVDDAAKVYVTEGLKPRFTPVHRPRP